jgi:hypothetical protein
MVLATNSDCFPKRRWPVGLCGYEDHLHKLLKLPVRTSQETHAVSITTTNAV